MLHPAGGKVPADLFALHFRPGTNLMSSATQAPQTPTARLYRVSGWKREAVPLTLVPNAAYGFLVEPQQPLPAGTVVALEIDAPACGGSSTEAITAVYQLTEPRSIPASLGSLQVTVTRAALVLPSRSGACADPFDVVYADLKLVSASGAAALDGLLRYELMVDGKPVSRAPESRRDATQSALRGSERVVAHCAKQGAVPPSQAAVQARPNDFTGDALAPGAHRAKLVGTLPNGAVLETEEVAFELRCEDHRPPTAGKS